MREYILTGCYADSRKPGSHGTRMIDSDMLHMTQIARRYRNSLGSIERPVSSIPGSIIGPFNTLSNPHKYAPVYRPQTIPLPESLTISMASGGVGVEYGNSTMLAIIKCQTSAKAPQRNLLSANFRLRGRISPVICVTDDRSSRYNDGFDGTIVRSVTG